MFGRWMTIDEFYKVNGSLRRECSNLGKFLGTSGFSYCDWPEQRKALITVETTDKETETILRKYGFSPV